MEKIKAEALMGGDEGWAFQIEFQGVVAGKRFAVIDWQEYLDLKEAEKKVAGRSVSFEGPDFE